MRMPLNASHLVGLDAVRAKAADYAHRLGIRNFTIDCAPRGDGSPYIEISDAYHFVVEERGLELERRTTRDLDELLYWVFNDVTFTVASSFELRNRRPDEDSRRQLFAKQEELLNLASEAWGRRKESEHKAVLANYPFNDALG